MKEYQDVYKTVGAFSWNELSTSNPKAATEFYGTLFGWKFETMNMGQGDYHIVKVGETSMGGVMAPPPQAQGMPPAWGCYVTVANTEATAAKCKSLGGRVLVEPMDIPTVGRFAVLQDPQGAVFTVIAYTTPAGS